jgi:catechol 2,3-dioxygenase-like lactoylglutathione lyase family enzyme
VDAAAPGTITSIRLVTVFSATTTARSPSMWTAGLGLEGRDDTEWGRGFRLVEVAPTGSQTSLLLVRPSVQMMGPERADWAEGRVGGPTGVVFETNDIEAAYATLVACGVHFLDAPAPHSWGGCAARFADPDGNVFLLVEPDRT